MLVHKELHMAELSIDFSSVPDYKPIPQGDYVVEVIEVVGPTKSNAGNDMLTLTMEIAEGDFQGRKLGKYFLMLQPADALWRTKKDLGVLLDIDEDSKSAKFDPADLMGARALAYVANEIWKVEDGGDGESRPKVRRLKALSGVADLFEK